MAVLDTMKKAAVAVKVRTSTSGTLKLASVNLGSLDMTQFSEANKSVSNQKVMNIVTLLEDVLKYPVYTVEKVLTSTLSNS